MCPVSQVSQTLMPNVQTALRQLSQAVPSPSQFINALPDPRTLAQAVLPDPSNVSDVISGVQALPGLINNNITQFTQPVTGLMAPGQREMTVGEVNDLNTRSLATLNNPTVALLLPAAIQDQQWKLVIARQQAILSYLITLLGQQNTRISLSA